MAIEHTNLFDTDQVREYVLSHLPPCTASTSVAIFRSLEHPGTCDVLLNEEAARIIEQNKSLRIEAEVLHASNERLFETSRKDLQMALSGLRKATQTLERQTEELVAQNRDLAARNGELSLINEELAISHKEMARKHHELSEKEDIANRLIAAKFADLHRYNEVRPKSMLGLLGWLARAYCKTELHTPAGSYADRLTAVLDPRKQPPKDLSNDFKDHPLLEKCLTKSAVSKMSAAASIDVRNADAHLENRPLMLLSNLFSLEQWSWENGLFGPGEEGAESCALQIMLARLGPTRAREMIKEINSNPTTYVPLAKGQQDRVEMFL